MTARKTAAQRPIASPAAAAAEADATATAPDAGEPAGRVLQQFRVVFNAVKTHFQQVERKAGVGGAQVWALSIIRDRPGIGVNDLAMALNIKQPTASNLVRNLVQQALITVRREGPDRRAVQLHPTPDGHKVLKRAPGPFAGVLPEALAGLDPHTLAQLESTLSALIRQLGGDERAATIPLAQMQAGRATR